MGTFVSTDILLQPDLIRHCNENRGVSRRNSGLTTASTRHRAETLTGHPVVSRNRLSPGLRGRFMKRPISEVRKILLCYTRDPLCNRNNLLSSSSFSEISTSVYWIDSIQEFPNSSKSHLWSSEENVRSSIRRHAVSLLSSSLKKLTWSSGLLLWLAREFFYAPVFPFAFV